MCGRTRAASRTRQGRKRELRADVPTFCRRLPHDFDFTLEIASFRPYPMKGPAAVSMSWPALLAGASPSQLRPQLPRTFLPLNIHVARCRLTRQEAVHGLPAARKKDFRMDRFCRKPEARIQGNLVRKVDLTYTLHTEINERALVEAFGMVLCPATACCSMWTRTMRATTLAACASRSASVLTSRAACGRTSSAFPATMRVSFSTVVPCARAPRRCRQHPRPVPLDRRDRAPQRLRSRLPAAQHRVAGDAAAQAIVLCDCAHWRMDPSRPSPAARRGGLPGSRRDLLPRLPAFLAPDPARGAQRCGGV